MGGQTALHAAAFMGSDVLVELLLQRKAEATATDTGMCTPLQRAAEGGMASVCARLLYAKAVVNGYDACRRSPLLLAMNGNHGDATRVLLSRGAKLEGKATASFSSWIKSDKRSVLLNGLNTLEL